MNKEQMEVLNVVQEVLRGVVISLGALNPNEIAKVAHGLNAFATNQKAAIEPESRAMLADLARGIGMISSAGQTKQ